MKYRLNQFIKKLSIKDYGIFLFLSGIFFIPSALFIGILLLLPASIIGSFLQKKNYLEDKWNYPFLAFGTLILISSFLQNFFLSNDYYKIWDPMLSIIGMFNWLPFIWFFWAFQPYLDSKIKRRAFGLILIAGTFPVLLSGFAQFFLNWTGPFKTLYDLIIWYQRPIENPGGLSGLFSNQNYAGSWLNFVWPFCIAIFLETRDNIFRKTVTFSFLISIGLAAFLTYSRNAWIGLLTSIPLVIDIKKLKFFISFTTVIILIIFFLISPIFSGEIQEYLRSFIPIKILHEFTDAGYQSLDHTRFEIMTSAINLIKANPFFGIGAASFSPIFFLETNSFKAHSHNLLLELSISYGLPTSIIFFTTISIILILSFKKIFIKTNMLEIRFFDRAFWASLFFFLISQLFDIQYFDGKISIIAWILLAGLKNIIDEKKNKKFIS
tara:strand:+ start:390 stop:1700 length:1311 start_codon:yes stop_codon:yes gene_type:complete